MDFTRKARWVKDKHKTPDRSSSNFARVVSRESVRIAFTYSMLNDLDVWYADIQNAHLTALLSQKHYIICGDKFGAQRKGCFNFMSSVWWQEGMKRLLDLHEDVYELLGIYFLQSRP